MKSAFGELTRSISTVVVSGLIALVAIGADSPKPTGKLVDLDGHKLHLNIVGQGSPTVVVENGLGVSLTKSKPEFLPSRNRHFSLARIMSFSV